MARAVGVFDRVAAGPEVRPDRRDARSPHRTAFRTTARAPVPTMSGTSGPAHRIPCGVPHAWAAGTGAARRLRPGTRGKKRSGGICADLAANGMTPRDLPRLTRDRRGSWRTIIEPFCWWVYIVTGLGCQGHLRRDETCESRLRLQGRHRRLPLRTTDVRRTFRPPYLQHGPLLWRSEGRPGPRFRHRREAWTALRRGKLRKKRQAVSGHLVRGRKQRAPDRRD